MRSSGCVCGISFAPAGNFTRTTYGPALAGSPTRTARRASGGNAGNDCHLTFSDSRAPNCPTGRLCAPLPDVLPAATPEPVGTTGPSTWAPAPPTHAAMTAHEVSFVKNRIGVLRSFVNTSNTCCACCTVVLIYSNCALRSGWEPPSYVLRLL